VQTTLVHVLCDDFGPALDSTASVPSTVPGKP
jgi:hypothetical protein